MSTFILTTHGADYHVGGFNQHENSRVDGPIAIEVIAHSLAQINRFTGHAIRPYSVAEHSLLCVEIAERLQLNPWARMAALMHDAHEAFTGDISSPAKWELGTAWKNFEDTHSWAVRRAFGLHERFRLYHEQVQRCDLIALATERRDLLPFKPGVSSPWPLLDRPGFEIPCAHWTDLNTLKRKQRDWTEWRDLFLEKFRSLKGASVEWFAANVREHQA